MDEAAVPLGRRYGQEDASMLLNPMEPFFTHPDSPLAVFDTSDRRASSWSLLPPK